ncbi:hypothetical protein TSUD_298540 [Trifolium subterraneum]|nr:hypothetical protein TSUD_298540 [Trifolium subterraneum]
MLREENESLNLNLLIEGVEKLDNGDGTKLRDKHISHTKNNDKENKKSDNKTNKPEEEKPKKRY